MIFSRFVGEVLVNSLSYKMLESVKYLVIIGIVSTVPFAPESHYTKSEMTFLYFCISYHQVFSDSIVKPLLLSVLPVSEVLAA